MYRKFVIPFFVFLPDDYSNRQIQKNHELQLHQIKFKGEIFAPIYLVTPGRKRAEGPACELQEAGGHLVPAGLFMVVHRAWKSALTQADEQVMNELHAAHLLRHNVVLFDI